MSHQSADELKQGRIAIMGQDLGAILYSLYNEILWIKFKWIEYVELYGTSQERINVMNRSAPWLFFIVQRTLFDDILLGLAKITDPPGVGNKETVSVLAISQFINDTDLKKKVSKCIKEIKTNTEFCRDWRNRKIAHKDRKLALGDKTAPYPLYLLTGKAWTMPLTVLKNSFTNWRRITSSPKQGSKYWLV